MTVRSQHTARIVFSAAAATLGILGLTAPQVAAADRPIPSISAKADKNARATCAIFDNNTSGAKWMKLKLCSNYTAEGCASDEGNFSQYAGPVYRAHGGCGTVTALMKNTSSSSTYLVNAVRDSTNCN